jgi:long-chain acyl-CoA synthetase
VSASAPPPILSDRELEAAIRVGLAPALWAARDPGRSAVVDPLRGPSGDRSFAELEARATRLARGLRAGGLAPGDGIALLCRNRAEFCEVWAAGARTGLRLTPVNWHLTAGEVAYVLDDCEADAFVADASLAGVAADAVAAAPRARVRLAVGGAIAGFEPYDAFLERQDPTPIGDPTLGTTMLYTSGTTGRPKGVQRAPDPEAAVRALVPYAYRAGNVHLCTGPLYHAAPFGISMAIPLSAGVPVVLMDAWDAEETLRLVERHRVTHTHMVPTMFHRLLALPLATRRRHDLSSLVAVVHGAAPCPVEIKRRMIEWLGPVLYEYYAATEGPGTVVDSKTWLARPGTVGRVADQVLVGDERGAALPPGEEGLVWLRASEQARFGYFKDAEKTARSYRADGRYYTLGDVGRLDAEGYLFLTDRSANLIISGGVNVYPAEVDAVLLLHPAVADVATIGVPNEEWGEEVLAVVELATGCAPTQALADELTAFARARLAHYKCPRRVDFVARLPREDNGKIYKRRLRDEYRAARHA